LNPSTVLVGDVLDGLRSLPDGCVHCCVTSPPYWGLRDYGVEGQIGLEATPDAFVARMVEVFGEVRRVLREDGTLWLNLGDSYAGSARGGHPGEKSTLEGYTGSQDEARRARMTQSRRRDDAMIPRSDVAVDGLKPKDLCMMPWRVALALQADGWWIRSVIVWAKKSPMPESCRDRPTSSWEPIFLLTKSERYFYDAEAVKEAAEYGFCPGGMRASGRYLNGNIDNDGQVAANTTVTPGSGGTRNLRNVWHLGPEPYADAHFATFPTEIPRRAIKAGTSEKGCCPKCGAGWVRMVERPKPPTSMYTNSRKPDDIKPCGGGGGMGQKLQDWYDANPARTTGWSPSCECSGGAGEPVPCLVLDPFLGSGTTVAVARELGRHGVGCELNPEYAQLARERIGRAEKPLTFRSSKATDGGLFTEGHQ